MAIAPGNPGKFENQGGETEEVVSHFYNVSPEYPLVSWRGLKYQ